MKIETDRLIIRSVERGDGTVYADMAKDGSLLDVGFDINCAEWMEGWISGAMQRDKVDNPQNDYIAYTNYFFAHYPIKKLIATIREENVASWKTIEKASFQMVERKMYQDINDAKEELYRFYEITV